MRQEGGQKRIFLNFDCYEDFCEINNKTLSLKEKG